MGLVQDFVRFVSGFLLGKKDATRAYLEAISMGDRYLRWASERRDIRDYYQALEQFELCSDEDAPKAEMLMRKYNGLCDCTIGAVQLLIEKYRQNIAAFQQTGTKLQGEKKQTQDAIDLGQKRIEQMKREGSLIKAKEEERKLTDLQHRMSQIDEALANDDHSAEIMTSFVAMNEEGERLCIRLENSLSLLSAKENIPAQEIVQTLRSKVLDRLEGARGEMRAANPNLAQAGA